jgi:predicted permease
MLRRAPLSSSAVILAMALGVGASTAAMSITESALIRPLPFDRPGELVALHTVAAKFGDVPETNFRDARDLRDRSRTLVAVGLYDAEDVGIRTADDATPIAGVGLAVDAHFQDVLSIHAALGRLFDDSDTQVGAAPAALIADRFWRHQLGLASDIIGRRILVGSQRFTIVGVLPPSAERFPAGGADVWTPLVVPETSFLYNRGSLALTAVGRMTPGATLASVAAEISAISARLEAENPMSNAGRRLGVAPLQSTMTGPIRPMLLLIGGATSLLLLIACANIGNLFLAQSFGRRHEFYVRAALGASRRDLIWQLIAETVVACGVAGIVGLGLAPFLTRMFLELYPDTLPLSTDLGLDGRVVAAALALTLLAAAIAGIPRLRSLRHSGGWQGHSRGLVGGIRPRLSLSLMAVQVALSIVLLSASLLLATTFASVGASQPGFNPAGLLTVRVSIPSQASPDQLARVQDDIRDVAAVMPDVTAAAHAMFIPFTPGSWGDMYHPIDVADPTVQRPIAHFFMVSPEYLDTLGIRVASGRGFTSRDTSSSPRVIIVSRQFARTAFATDDAIGRRIQWNDDVWEVVGITNDVRHSTPWEAPDDDVYVPRRQVVRGNTWLLLRTTAPSGVILRDLQKRMKLAGVPGTVMSATSMQQRLDDLGGPARFRAALSACLAAVALCLTAVGVYAIAAFNVAERVREIGVRLALGATPQSVVRQVVGQSWLGVAYGLVPGLLASLTLRQWLDAWLYGFVPAGQSTVLLAAALFVGLTTLAAWIPSRRASQIDPALSLRPE